MLEAKKNFLFEKIFVSYNRFLLKRRFYSIKISGLEYLENRNPDLPMIIYANHSSWWDGLVIFEVLSKFKFENYVMMEEKQLRKLRFFRLLGAFSVVRENPREAIKSINYAVKMLSEKTNCTLLIFPQGEILPSDFRPMRFFNGLSKIIEKTGDCLVCSMAIRYEFLGQYKPEIFISLSEPKIANFAGKFVRKESTRNLENNLSDSLDLLKCFIIKCDFDNFEDIL